MNRKPDATHFINISNLHRGIAFLVKDEIYIGFNLASFDIPYEIWQIVTGCHNSTLANVFLYTESSFNSDFSFFERYACWVNSGETS